jgi:hypothetical protein
VDFQNTGQPTKNSSVLSMLHALALCGPAYLTDLLLLTPPKLHTPGHSALPSQHLALPPDVS